MDKIIADAQALMGACDQEKIRTPYLDIAKGRLDAAVKNLVAHRYELAKQKEARMKEIEEKTAELEKLQEAESAPEKPTA